MVKKGRFESINGDNCFFSRFQDSKILGATSNNGKRAVVWRSKGAANGVDAKEDVGNSGQGRRNVSGQLWGAAHGWKRAQGAHGSTEGSCKIPD